MTLSHNLPTPDIDAQYYSEQLLSLIKQKIADANGKIRFAEYMNLCLYTPGLGYYSAGSHILGKHGDFITAPEISSLFSRTLAQHIIDVFNQTERSHILEFGAGNGKMAVDILLELESNQSLPEQYYIIEVSDYLRQRQQNMINQHIPQIADSVVWLDNIPNNFIGVVLANEVCDAMPVNCLHFKNGKIYERCIENTVHGLRWCGVKLASSLLADRAAKIQTHIGDIDYITEINLTAEAWVASLADNLQQGTIFIIDYGHSEASYYHPQRSTGTLMCYYQHQGHDDPLILQGLQDITAHVDFTALAQIALDNDLNVAGFQSQAAFLFAGGITSLMASNNKTDDLTRFQQTNEIKRLTLPSEMGETFKVLTLSKNLDHLLDRIQFGDRRQTL